ncbi:hypothetical protein MPLDJ20_180042 [Mesorhizobium plurifarium]|uniref:Uncharacterized protein n=1 Tax=Mesorhizobium plurifarium TaxID=69974 RepID=A0A090EXV3_MESPL|nr:hypothetical protein MPLDJ20_180042 [Mesorhizobium plurifarium]
MNGSAFQRQCDQAGKWRLRPLACSSFRQVFVFAWFRMENCRAVFAEIHLSEALHIPDITPRLTIRHHWVRRGMAYPLRPLRLLRQTGVPRQAGQLPRPSRTRGTLSA